MALSKIKSESLDLTDNYSFTGTVTGAGGGKLFQVVNSDFSTHGNFNQDTNVSIGSINITPSATSSKILLMSKGRVENYDYSSGDDMNQSCLLIFFRTISGGSESQLFVARHNESAAGTSYRRLGPHISSHYVDSPNTTSQITYTLKVHVTTQDTRQGYSAESGLVAIEIGA